MAEIECTYGKVSREYVEHLRGMNNGEFIEFFEDDKTFFYRNGFQCITDYNSYYPSSFSSNTSMNPYSSLKCRHYMKEDKNEGSEKPKRIELFVEREIFPETSVALSKFKNWMNIHKKRYRDAAFEKVIGFRISHVPNNADRLYHSYSGGVSIFGINSDTPDTVKRKLMKKLARGLREIHDDGIEYSDPLPTDMRYNFGEKVTWSPHACMLFGLEFPDTDDKIRKSDMPRENHPFVNVSRDIGILVYTNPWIDDLNEFVFEYGGDGIKSSMRKTIAANADGNMWMYETGSLEGPNMIWRHPEGKGYL